MSFCWIKIRFKKISTAVIISIGIKLWKYLFLISEKVIDFLLNNSLVEKLKCSELPMCHDNSFVPFLGTQLMNCQSCHMLSSSSAFCTWYPQNLCCSLYLRMQTLLIFIFRLQENLCSGAWSMSSPSFSDVCSTVERNTFSLLSPAAVAQQYSLLLKYIIPEVLSPFLMGSVLASSIPSWSQLALNLLDTGEDSTQLSSKRVRM